MPGYNAYNYVNPYSQPFNYQIPQVPQTPQVQQQTQQIQDGGFVRVRNIDEARNWAVAPGNSVTFKVENSPYICTKTMGFSQLEQPKFELFRLVKEDEPEKKAEPSILDDMKGDIESLKKRLDDIEKRQKEDTGA